MWDRIDIENNRQVLKTCLFLVEKKVLIKKENQETMFSIFLLWLGMERKKFL